MDLMERGERATRPAGIFFFLIWNIHSTNRWPQANRLPPN
uniref:Uncharacterized protein n=1 Tax=Arundo donax TaxID=35708 RepID=A0A0A8ZU55_ARUDO